MSDYTVARIGASMRKNIISRPEIVISVPEMLSLAQRWYFWARDTKSGPEILSLGQRYISGPEIINFYARTGPYRHRK